MEVGIHDTWLKHKLHATEAILKEVAVLAASIAVATHTTKGDIKRGDSRPVAPTLCLIINVWIE